MLGAEEVGPSTPSQMELVRCRSGYPGKTFHRAGWGWISGELILLITKRWRLGRWLRGWSTCLVCRSTGFNLSTT